MQLRTQYVYLALIGATKAAGELLGGAGACEAGKQTVTLYDGEARYDRASCETEKSDQTNSGITDLMGKIDASNGYECHKDGYIAVDSAGK